MVISVSSAASLFKENGHDLKGLYHLFVNAVTTDQMNRLGGYAPSYNDYAAYLLAQFPYAAGDFTCSTKDELIKVLENFDPDAEKGEKRIQKFYEDYKRLKELSEKIKPYSLWAIFFTKNKELHAYMEEKCEIESMTISLEELLHVAYYKFTQIRGTKKQFVDGFTRYLQTS